MYQVSVDLVELRLMPLLCDLLFTFYVFVQIVKCICSNCKMYLSKLQNIFLQIAKYICQNCKIYLSKLHNVFVQIAKCICPNYQMYFSKLTNVFVQIATSILFPQGVKGEEGQATPAALVFVKISK